MATAAPAAPAAAPQAPAGNVTAPGLNTPTAPTSADQGAASPPKKLLKPIPKSKIPGVKAWNTAAPAVSEPAPTVAEPAAQVFTIAGKQYTQADLETAFHTLDGRVKANERDAQAYRLAQKAQREAKPAAETVPARVSRETQDRAGEQPTTPQEKAADKRWIEAQGEPFWNQVKQVHAQHGPEVALAYVMDKFDTSLSERMQGIEQQILSKLAPALTPILQERVESQNKHFAQDVWSEFSTYTSDETGEPLFPELAQNPKLAQVAGSFWLGLRQKYGDKFAMSEYGLYSALRDAQAFMASEVEQGKNAGNAAQAVMDAIEYDRKAGARTAIQAPSAPPVSAPEANPNDGDAIKKRIREAKGGFIKTKTGFNMGVRPLNHAE